MKKIILINNIFKTEKETEKGLMFIKDIPENIGSLFIMPNIQIWYFWMADTYVSLDIIFLNNNFKIIGFVENAEILNTTPLYVNKPSKYIIEIKGGYIKKNNINIGDIIKPILINNDDIFYELLYSTSKIINN